MKLTKRRWLIFAAALLIVIAGIVILLRRCGKDPGTAVDKGSVSTNGADLSISTAISDKGPEQLSQAEILAELNRKVAESMITMSMNPDPTFPTWKSMGNLLIHNDEANRHAQVVQIYRDDTGDLIYSSGLIPVGKYVNQDSLDEDLEPGDYPCTAYFHAVNAETGTVLGTGAVRITVHIKD